MKKICETCGTEFKRAKYRPRFCSDKCGAAASRAAFARRLKAGLFYTHKVVK